VQHWQQQKGQGKCRKCEDAEQTTCEAAMHHLWSLMNAMATKAVAACDTYGAMS
jgi:hypothetical protein